MKNEESIIINDIRTSESFKKSTFSKFKKTDVIRKCIYSINENKIEESLYWMFELLSSGHILEIWNIIFEIMSKYIYYGNPKLPIYIEMRMNEFKKIIKHIQYDEIYLRNHNDIRFMFGEIIIILCISEKKNKLNLIKISSDDLFMEMKSMLVAPSLDYANTYYTNFDPPELLVPFNEFSYHIYKKNPSLQKSIFWIEWIYVYEKTIKKKKLTLKCKKRNYVKLNSTNDNLYSDVIWIIWEAIFKEVKRRENMYAKIIDSIYSLFILHYTASTKTKRKYMIYHVLYLLCESWTKDVNIIQSNRDIENENIKKITNKIFEQLKKNEVHVLENTEMNIKEKKIEYINLI